MAFAVWLHGYLDGARQSISNVPPNANTRLVLPKPAWFLERARLAPERPGPEVSCDQDRPKIELLAWVEVACVRESILSPFTEEEDLLHTFLQHPTDFFCLEVKAWAKVERPFVAGSAQRRRFARADDGQCLLVPSGSDVVDVVVSKLTTPLSSILPRARL